MWDDLVKEWLWRSPRTDINPHLGRCLMLELEKGWVEEAVAHGDGEVIPGILFVLSCVAIVGECQAAASSSACRRGLKLSTVTDAHVNTQRFRSEVLQGWRVACGNGPIMVCVSPSAGQLCELHPHDSTNWPIFAPLSCLHAVFFPRTAAVQCKGITF